MKKSQKDKRVFDKANGLVRLTMDKRTANALAVLLSKLSITDLNALRLGAEVNQLDAVYLLLRAKLQKLESNAKNEPEKTRSTQ